MTRFLAISSSPNPAQSHTKGLIDQFIKDWSISDPSMEVTHRDIGSQPPVHLDGATIGAFYTPLEELTDAQKPLLAYSDQVIEELEQADIILIGVPMHNFGIPSTLKAWIDHVARVGKTFSYTDKGPVGLLTNKKVIVLGARGGNYSPTSHLANMDHQTPFLKTALNFVGLNDISFIYAEGVAGGGDGVEAAKMAIHNYVASAVLSQAA